MDIYKTIVVGTTNLVANGITDTINFIAGSGIILSGSAATDTITISASVDVVNQEKVSTGNTISLFLETQLLSNSSNGVLFNSSDTIVSTSLDIYKTIVVGSTNLVANGITDTVTFVAGTGIILTGNATTDTITISASVDSSSIIAGTGLTKSGNTIDINTNQNFNTADIDSLTINSNYTFPTVDGSANYILKTNGSGNVVWTVDSISEFFN